MRAQQEQEVRAILGRLTTDQLLAGVKRGRDQLSLLTAIEAVDNEAVYDSIGTEGHASERYIAWAQNDMTFRRAQLRSAISDTLAELERRGCPVMTPVCCFCEGDR